MSTILGLLPTCRNILRAAFTINHLLTKGKAAESLKDVISHQKSASEEPKAIVEEHLRLSVTEHDIVRLQEARHGDPFSILGKHKVGNEYFIRCFYPGARQVEALCDGVDPALMTETAPGFFECRYVGKEHYKLKITWANASYITEDPYTFTSLLTDFELHLFAEGRFWDLPRRFGANPSTVSQIDGVTFAVWAPNAASVSVVGDFNSWDPRRHPMRFRHGAGIWELFIPRLTPGEIYKFSLHGPDGHRLPFKADPMARRTELPPKTGSVIAPIPMFPWSDAAWAADRAARQSREAPISIYEVHVGGWLSTPEKQSASWDEAGDRLIPYVSQLGFTHLELMPIMEHPFGGSWGYQPLSLFAPTARLGDPTSFARFIDRCHMANLGVILDWVPAHFPADEHGLARFDGTALYEHEDPREGFHRDWNTLIYNLGRSEVKGFLIASALWWIETFHLDGLRVDAVASMLYRDYSRPVDEWVPNRFGGRENLEAIEFLKELNGVVRERCPGAIVIAEESTAWPGVTASPDKEGLGFDFKWNMGWMHDTLRYFSWDPIYRSFHLDDISFGLHYAFSEAFVLPLSHDEVVHGKGSLLGKMPGDEWQRFANLRLCFALMWLHPGKKLLFMGGEIAAECEWNMEAPFPWPDPNDVLRRGLSQMLTDLNLLYRSRPQLHNRDTRADGFCWVLWHDTNTSVFAFTRSDGDRSNDLLIILNTTPVPRANFEVGAPAAGFWIEVFNSDSSYYGGTNCGNLGIAHTSSKKMHDLPFALRLTLPPLGLIVLELKS
jgi:1,4-alpha-glucan branching enzyme